MFSAQLGSIVDTCTASVYGACEEALIFPGLSPYSELSLVRQRIHAVSQSRRLSGRFRGCRDSAENRVGSACVFGHGC